MALLPSAPEFVFPSAQGEEQEGTDADGTTIAALPVRSSETRVRIASFPSKTTLVPLDADSSPRFRLPVPALSVGVFAKRNGVGTPMRC
jgi:hypothetical protein